MATVYKATNKVNGKCYIGITKNKFSYRKKCHLNCAKNLDKNRSYSAFHKALTKYGIENFEWEILEACDESLMSDREIYYIDLYHSYVKENGYNLTKGGVYNFGASGEYYWLSRMTKEEREEWLQNNRFGKNNGMYANGDIVSGENHFSYNYTNDEKKNWLNNISGENNYQKKMTKNELSNKCWINKLSDEEKQIWINKNLKGENNPFYKNTKLYVITFPNGEEYIIKISEFCRNYTNVKLYSNSLYDCANGKYSQHKGFKCRLYNPIIDINLIEWKQKEGN